MSFKHPSVSLGSITLTFLLLFLPVLSMNFLSLNRSFYTAVSDVLPFCGGKGNDGIFFRTNIFKSFFEKI